MNAPFIDGRLDGDELLTDEQPFTRCECMESGPTYSNSGDPDHDGSPDECPNCHQGNRPLAPGDVVEVPCPDGDCLASCPYLARFESRPGHDPEATCSFGCLDEPVCVTCGPWECCGGSGRVQRRVKKAPDQLQREPDWPEGEWSYTIRGIGPAPGAETAWLTLTEPVEQERT